MASITRRPGETRWQARYRDPAGRQLTRRFDRKIDAQRWLDEQAAAMVTGQYVDPRAGRVTVREYAEQWRGIQSHRPTTALHVETMLRRHVYPALGDRALSDVLPSHVQALVAGLSDVLAPSTVAVVHRLLAGIFTAAVADRRVVVSPCAGTKLPKRERRQVEPLGTDVVRALGAAVPDRYAALVVLAAGTGMRQGECFGLTVDRVDFLHRVLVVDRQLVLVPGREPYLAPPKTAASVRSIPVPDVVLEALAGHLERYPVEPGELVFTSEEGRPIRRTRFSERVWQPATRAAGAPGVVFHELRHYYASLLIRHGESVKTVQARLGHASASETLDTYSHLWPDSDDRTREAVQVVLGDAEDTVRTTAGAETHPRRSAGVVRRSQPVRRVLFPRPVTRPGAATIHLGVPLPTPSSGLPGSSGGQPSSAPCSA